MDSKLTIGLDFGTDSVRALLVDTANGEILASASTYYERWGHGDYSDACELRFRQHPLDYLKGMKQVVHEILQGIDPQRIAGIGVDTTGSTPCPVNRQGVPLALLPDFENDPDAMFILWKDHTAIAEAEAINAQASNWKDVNYTQYSGGTYSCEWFFAKILHILRQNPQVRQVAFSWVEHCDWITALLTGNSDPISMHRSRCAAGHKAMWHASWNGLPADAFLKAIDPLLGGLRSRLYTDTQTADKPAGTLCPEWASKLGLPVGITVAGGMVDGHVGAVGAGIRPGVLVKVFGTSSPDIAVTPQLAHAIPGICGQVDGSVLPGLIGLEAGQAAFGDIYAWCNQLVTGNGKKSLVELERVASQLPITPDGLLAIDWFNGRRTPKHNPHLRGSLIGLTLGTTAPMIYRALVEATCCGARSIVEYYRSEGVEVSTVVAVGGISRKSPFVMQTCADLLNMPIQVVKSDQVCALGGAMYAAVASGIYPDITTAIEKMNSGIDIIYRPDPERVELYERLYQRYLRYATFLEKEQMLDLKS